MAHAIRTAVALSTLTLCGLQVAWAETCLSRFTAEHQPVVRLDFSDQDLIEKHDPSDDRERPLYFYLKSSARPPCTTSDHRYTVDVGTDFSTWLDSRLPKNSSTSNRSLAIQITSNVDQNVKDKVLFSIASHDGERHLSLLRDSNERYVSFNFMLDAHYEVPHNWALHFQAWQCCGGHPPFAIRVIPGRNPQGPVVLDFVISNDEIENAGKDLQSISSIPIERNRWYSAVLKLKPRPIGWSEKGEIALWLDTKEIFSWHGYWGYQPNNHSVAAKGVARDNIGLELGVYRRRQSTTQTILIDNLRLAPSFKEAGGEER